MKCLHYNNCIKQEPLCFDSKCKINRVQNYNEKQKVYEQVCYEIHLVKKYLNINSFNQMTKQKFDLIEMVEEII